LGATETTVIGARHAELPALAGAVVLALVESMIAVAVLLWPALSVTVPLLGAFTVVVAPLLPLTGLLPELLDHW